MISKKHHRSYHKIHHQDFGLESKAITPTASFINDLGFDSLDFAELVIDLERRFDISIPFSMVEKSGETVLGLVEIIERQLQNKSQFQQK